MTKPTTYPWSPGDQYLSSEANQVYAEMNNLISTSGQTPNPSDDFQTAKSAAQYASVGDFYVEGGGSAANAYVLEGVSNFQEVHSLDDGLRVRFKATNSNTTASTVNVNSLGAKTITMAGKALVGGEIIANSFVDMIYNSSTDDFEIANGFASAQQSVDGLFFHRTISVAASGSSRFRVFNVASGSNSFSGIITVINTSDTGSISSTVDYVSAQSAASSVATTNLAAHGISVIVGVVNSTDIYIQRPGGGSVTYAVSMQFTGVTNGWVQTPTIV